MENKQYVLRETADQLTADERDEVFARIKATTDLPNEKLVFTTTDGTKFNEGYESQAFEWELRLWNKENIKIKYDQKELPDWFFFLAQPTEINPETLKDIDYRKAYVVNIPNAAVSTINEICYLHPMLKDCGKFMECEIEPISPKKVVIVYTQIDGKRIDPREADCVSVTHAKKLADRLRKMLDFVELL